MSGVDILVTTENWS